MDPTHPTDSGPPRRDPPPAREALLLALAAFALIGGAFAWLNWPADAGDARITAVDRPDPARRTEYVGSAACAECHPGEDAYYARSGHGRTLRAAERTALARQLDGRTVDDPEQPGVTWTYALADGRLHVDRAEAGEVERLLIDYAFGSGHHATTFVTVLDPDRPAALEHRLTHRARDDAFYITPGQAEEHRGPDATPRGRLLSARETAKCFSCHATPTVPEAGLHAGELVANVGCERCHGPGRAHVAAARAGRAGPAMPYAPERQTPAGQMNLCGQCHRHPSKAEPGRLDPDDPSLARFQPVGIMASACFTRGGRELTCTTCHDPHARASDDHAEYEATCLACHDGREPAHPACPVGPESGCIGCHMPKVDSGQSVLFTDHWIRVRRPAGASASAD